MLDKKRRVVLITGGTKGIGLATALRFAREGDQCIITYGWGSVEDDAVLEVFKAENLPLPYLKQADVIQDEDTEELIRDIFEKFGPVEVFISNVSFASLIKSPEEYSEKALLKSVEYSSWPMIAYTKKMKEVTGQYPKYVIGYSSHGPDTFYRNYDYAAITKAVLEVMVKYLTYHFFDQGVIFNIVRTRPIITDSLLSTLGNEWADFIARFDIPGTDVSLDEFAKVAYMLCSGFMDGIRGQTIIADKGYCFADNFQYIYTERERLGL